MNCKPDITELQHIIDSKLGNAIPIYLEMPADLLTPVSAYLKLAKDCAFSFLFESVEGGSKIGRYSFLGANPKDVFSIGEGKDITGDPLKFIESKKKDIKFVPDIRQDAKNNGNGA